ncbi:MAG: hypothetical protein IJW16_03080 [Clostridia bacterium]|nr:hypothetical protein [Clostridia bacterium]
MIKGSRKQMIVLRTEGNRYFDEAYFILRREIETTGGGGDILAEANRILEESAPRRIGRLKRARGAILGFFAGSAAGAVVCGLIIFLL